jgi:hypothetical protein
VTRRILIIVQNLPVPFDRRVWLECHIAALMDDEPRRARLGKLGRARVEQELAWSYSERAYLGVYERLTSADRRGA